MLTTPTFHISINDLFFDPFPRILSFHYLTFCHHISLLIFVRLSQFISWLLFDDSEFVGKWSKAMSNWINMMIKFSSHVALSLCHILGSCRVANSVIRWNWNGIIITLICTAKKNTYLLLMPHRIIVVQKKKVLLLFWHNCMKSLCFCVWFCSFFTYKCIIYIENKQVCVSWRRSILKYEKNVRKLFRVLTLTLWTWYDSYFHFYSSFFHSKKN